MVAGEARPVCNANQMSGPPSQKDLADQFGVKQSTVAKWETKGAVYRKITRQKFAKVFGVDEDIFL